MECAEDPLETYTIDEADPLPARARSEWSVRPHRPELAWETRVGTRSEISRDGQHFVTSDEVIRTEGEEVLFRRIWEIRTPRAAG
ncbi:hypothetical protein [Streptomyces sp. NPDC098781]|uniref:hypothetical protein n=1 Tax=Streptomyces sp. NPDC098781 TaxID=3366097 RepID=UPI00380D8035